VETRRKMETRGAVRRSALQRLAAEQLTQNWLQRQGPYNAPAALSQIQRNNQDAHYNNNNNNNGDDDDDDDEDEDDRGQEEIEPGPVARATDATFAGLSPFDRASAGKHNIVTLNKPKRTPISLLFRYDKRLLSYPTQSYSPDIIPIEPSTKQRRITRSCTRRLQNDIRANLLEKVLQLVFDGGHLHWYEFMRLSVVNRSCLAFWFEKRETAGPWKAILKELNALNGTNKCHRCEQVLFLKSHRNLCIHATAKTVLKNGGNNDNRNMNIKNINSKIKKNTQNLVWENECAKRTPDFVSCVDIIMSNGVLNWRERGGIRRICKATYKVHKECCTCKHPVDRSTSIPFLHIDPRYQVEYYEDWTDYEKCEALIRYSLALKNNLHSFYNFKQVDDPDSLPYGLARWNWFDIQMVNLQSNCPKRYAFAMHLVSLFIAQGELQRFPPIWYADAFVGTQHRPYAHSFVEILASTISEHCLPGKCCYT
jgi:hypothetical protein